MAIANAKSFTTKDLKSFGELLHSYLVDKYPNLLNVTSDFTTTTWSKDITAAIEDVFKSLKILTGQQTTIDSLQTIQLSNGFREGDVLINTSSNNHIYLVTSVDSYIRTFPILTKEDAKLVNPLFPTPMIVKRISNLGDKIDQQVYSDFATKVISKNTRLVDLDSSYFQASNIPVDSTHLQIGDLIFGVDPVQISFTTQNGYQLFPTVRSDGNPKLSTGQQVKNIGVSLIFPNADSINNQLIPLYAMFRRTPFVNIRNREITRFFYDLISEESLGWIPVALESINIQSIDGFPNSLQADVSFLPMDATTLGNAGLKALKSINDVIVQQDLNSRNKEQERINDLLSSKLLDSSLGSKNSDELIDYIMESSEDFRESVPFRAFYQSLISDRTEVKDEDGRPAVLYNSGGKVFTSTRQIDEFRPRREENKLTSYLSEHNRSPVTLRYKYIPKNYIDVTKAISNNRKKLTQEKIERVNTYISEVKNGKDLAQVIIPIFLSTDDLTRQYSYLYSQSDNIINRAFAEMGLDVSVKSKTYGAVSFIFKSLLNVPNLGILNNTLSNLSSAADSVDKTSSIQNWIYGASLIYTDSNAKDNNPYTGIGFKNIESAFNDLYNEIANDPKKKEVLITLLDKIANDIINTLSGPGRGETVVLTDGLGGVDETGYSVERLPITSAQITLDNEFDIITNWSISFSNKFVPFYLQLRKYPFYQHLGFEDAQLTLRVISVPRSNKYDLKAELSKMSDRVTESAKIVNISAPELIAFLDPRVTIESNPHSIFNALGIQNVVLNSSNTTNVQGKPDSWNTIINFTQAKFTIDQYHSIESRPNLSPIEMLLGDLISRLKIDSNGNLVIKKYYSNDLKIPDTRNLLYMSFIDSSAGSDFEKYLINLYKNGNIDKTTNAALQSDLGAPQARNAGISLTKGLLDSAFPGWDQVDATATGALRSVLANSSEIELIIKSVVKSYDEILKQQGELYKELITTKRSLWQSITHSLEGSEATTIAAVGTDASLVTLSLLLTAVAIPVLPMVLTTVGALALATIPITAAINIITDQGAQRIKDEAGQVLSNMADVIKRQVIIELAHAISKDPLIRDKLLSSEILYGDRIQSEGFVNVLSQFKENESQLTNFNCYSDFDIPPTVGTKDGRMIHVAPDFYLAINNISKATINTYLESALDSIGRTNQMSMELSMLSDTDVKLRFSNILNYIKEGVGKGTIKPELLEKLKIHFYGNSGETFDNEKTINSILKDNVTKYIKLVKTGTIPERVDSNDDISVMTDGDRKSINDALKDILDKDKSLSNKDRETITTLTNELLLGPAPVYRDADSYKYNFIVAQRDLILMELIELYYSIGSYLNSQGAFQGESNESKNRVALDYMERLGMTDKLNLSSTTKSSILQMKDDIGAILETFKDINSSDLAKNKVIKDIHKKYSKGMAAQSYNDKDESLAIPQIRILQNLVYNKIGYYVRLNTAIEEANPTASAAGAGEVNLDTLPELKFLEYFNRREFESTFRKLKITKEFESSINRQYDLSSRMFPTFKVLFIEEDGRISILDDYYSFNAIQSIEIVKNKTFASSTAVIRLSNVTGSLTDRLTFHRETRDVLNPNSNFTQDEAFFGTLNVKPGTRVLIKLGYGTSDTQLTTVFTGRILEMNVGPVTEMICQSFGAQLKQDLYAENFGFAANVSEHGDIASALLDKIPGLENFGSKELFRATILGSTSGKNFKNIKRNIFDRFVMSNIVGRLNGSSIVTDNPRDENIYLPYDVSSIVKWNPRFNWKVYQQSVWDALQELCLYHSSVDVVIRSYNNDGISSRSEQRETIVIGDKSGYYKSTDAYSLSSINYQEIDRRLEIFNSIKSKINKRNMISNKTDLGSGLGARLAAGAISAANNVAGIAAASFLRNKKFSEAVIVDDNKIVLKPEWEDVWNFFGEQTNYLIIGKYILGKMNVNVDTAGAIVSEFIAGGVRRVFPKLVNTPEESFLTAAANFQSLGMSSKSPCQENLKNGYLNKLNAFEEMLIQAGKLYAKDPSIWDSMSKEQFYDIKLTTTNYDSKLIMDPRYKKIQQHHLVSDSYNLLRNDIILNNNFANSVNLYYFDNPKMIDQGSLLPSDIKNINVWTTKAFRDIKDENLRPINSFQKNIDTSWFDLASTEKLFKNYGRIKLDGESVKKGTIQSNVEKRLSETIKKNGVNLDVPDWVGFPSYVLVGVNLLKKEVQTMYRGTFQIIGDPKIEPMDIVHLDDMMNDMQGAIEVEEVIHTFTPDQGFVTTITPSLIVYDRDPRQVEDTSIVNRVFKDITTNKNVNIGKAAIGTAAAVGGSLLTIFSPQKVLGGAIALGGLPLALSGINGMTTGYHRFLHDAMMEIMGGNVINFTALIYKGLPFMSGFDGVDYTNLRTLINHKVAGVKGLITRYSAFSDPYSAWLRTGFEPDEVSWTNLIHAPGLKQLVTLRNNGIANESIGFFDVLFGAANPFELKL